MPRARNIKPSFFKNELLVELPFEGRLLFIGLWTLADREGRLENRPKRIKMEIFPADNLDVDALLSMLESMEFIKRYGQAPDKHGASTSQQKNLYIQVLNFKKHQSPHVKEAESLIPKDESTVQAPDKHPLNPESPLLNPESPLLNPVLYDFDEFWNLYGIKKGRANCEKKYIQHIKKGVKHETIINGLKAYQAEYKKDGWHPDIKLPLTWLHGKHWEDEYTKELTSEEQLEEIKRNIGAPTCKVISS